MWAILSAPTSVFACALRTSALCPHPKDLQFAFASTKSLQVVMDGVASSSLTGLPIFGDTFWLYYIFCMGLGFSAPQANGRPLFAVETKELCIKGGTKIDHAYGGRQAVLHGEHSPLLLGAVCFATG